MNVREIGKYEITNSAYVLLPLPLPPSPPPSPPPQTYPLCFRKPAINGL